MKQACRGKGFTLVELLIAIMLTAIICSAVAGLTFAVSVAYEDSDSQSWAQAMYRTTSIRFADAVKYSRVICRSDVKEIALWVEDSNDDGAANPPEMVYFTIDASQQTLEMTTFDAIGFWAGFKINLDNVKMPAYRSFLMNNLNETVTTILDGCQNIEFVYDASAPDTGIVSLKYDVDDGRGLQHFEIVSAKRMDSEPFIY